MSFIPSKGTIISLYVDCNYDMLSSYVLPSPGSILSEAFRKTRYGKMKVLCYVLTERTFHIRQSIPSVLR